MRSGSRPRKHPKRAAGKVGLLLRFDEGLRRQLERAATAHNRSLNSEIVERLRASFRNEDRQAELEAIAEKAGKIAGEKAGYSMAALILKAELTPKQLLRVNAKLEKAARELTDEQLEEHGRVLTDERVEELLRGLPEHKEGEDK